MSIRTILGTTILLGSSCLVAAESTVEVWGLPSSDLMVLDVPRRVRGAGELSATVDGQPVRLQEVVGAQTCVVEVRDAWRSATSNGTLRVVFSRGEGTVPALVSTPSLTVTNAAFGLTFDRTKRAGLPSRLAWASGKTCDTFTWGDRIFASGIGVSNLQNARQATLSAGEAGPLFRQVRTRGAFTLGGKPCSGHPTATYDWLFFDAAPEWVMVNMTFTADSSDTWEQVHAGVLEFPFAAFDRRATAVTVGKDGRPEIKDLPRNGTADRPVGKGWIALLSGRDFAAVYSADHCIYTDPNRKVDYLHGSNRASYAQPWRGDRLMRQAFFRFGTSADGTFASLTHGKPPVARPEGQRCLDGVDESVGAWPGERIDELTAGGLTLRTGTVSEEGTRVALRSVVVDGRCVALRGPLFTAVVEDQATGLTLPLSSEEAWRSVTAVKTERGCEWRFEGPLGKSAGTNLTVTVAATASDGSRGIDWTFRGETGTNALAFAEASVGAISFVSTGRGMRALYPGCMGDVERAPCADSCRHRGSYPSMHCAMPWQAVWDESSGRGFFVGALDPKGGAKLVEMSGSAEKGTVTLAVPHRLAWDGAHPEASSALSGVIAWRPYAGDWYEAALIYRDWVRENAVWYPQMGPEGRVSTPMWFKRDLGFIVRTYGLATNVVKDVRQCRDYLGVPVMAHWYLWNRDTFDNDYPNYFPARPGFEAGVQTLHDEGCYAVPYTNGHIWDMHDRGAEDWDFTRTGAKGACRKRDGSFHTEKYHSVETNGQPVVFAAMCPASQVWHDKVGDNCRKVVNGADCDGFYMDQVGAFSTFDCRNAEHGHPFGGGSWWQEGYRKLLADQRATCRKPVFFATEGNGEHTFDQIDTFVCWNIPGGTDTVPAFEVCYSGAVFVYCRSYAGPKANREMRMKFANVLADGEMFGWFPSYFCTAPNGLNAYLRECVRFRHTHGAWFYKGEMRRPPRLVGSVPEWSNAWDVFGKKRFATMPIVQTGARRVLDYAYDGDGRRQWRTGRVTGAFVYFTNFSDTETVTSRVAFDWNDLGVDPARCTFTRVDAEGRRVPMTREEVEGPHVFKPSTCWGIEMTP